MLLLEIESNIRQKYSDSLLLCENSRFSNAIYLCGYCIEMALKYAIAENLNWKKFNTDGKFKFLKVHDLDLLVSLTGRETEIKKLPAWSIVATWDESKRYSDPSQATKNDTEAMLTSTKILAETLCKISL